MTADASSPQNSAEYYNGHHDKNEVTRLITQALYELGYTGVAERLQEESQLEIEVPVVGLFRSAILNGEWEEAEKLLLTLDLQPTADINYLRFLIHKQHYLELLENSDTKSALKVLRTKISVLPYDSNVLGLEEAERRLNIIKSLTNVLVYNSSDIKTVLDWDGAKGESRKILLGSLQEVISAEMMIPRFRLAKLLEQAQQFQLSRANYRIDDTPFSLCRDFPDDRSKFPLKPTKILKAHSDEVWYTSFSHDGKYLASASLDNSIIVWKLSDSSIYKVFEGHDKGVYCVEWSPDNTKLLSAGKDRKAVLWDFLTGDALHVLDAHTDVVSSCAWLPDGQHFLTGSPDRKMIMWDLQGQVVHEWSGIRVFSLAVTPDGKKLIVLSSEKVIHFFDLLTKEVIKEVEIDVPLFSVTTSKDSRYALINLDTDELQLWDLERYQVVRKYLGLPKAKDVMRSCFGGVDENIVMSGSQDSKLFMWNRETSNLVEILDAHSGGTVNCVRFSPVNPGTFASCGDDGLVKLWQPPSVLIGNTTSISEEADTN